MAEKRVAEAQLEPETIKRQEFQDVSMRPSVDELTKTFGVADAMTVPPPPAVQVPLAPPSAFMKIEPTMNPFTNPTEYKAELLTEVKSRFSLQQGLLENMMYSASEEQIDKIRNDFMTMERVENMVAALQNITDPAAMVNAQNEINNELGRLSIDAVQQAGNRASLLQAVYAPNATNSAGPLAQMSLALFSVPDLNGDGVVDQKDIANQTDTGNFDRNLALRDKDGNLLLSRGKYDFLKLDKLGRYVYDDTKEFVYNSIKNNKTWWSTGHEARGNFRFQSEGIATANDFDRWPDKVKEDYYTWVKEKAVDGTGYDKLTAFTELAQKKPMWQWTDEEKSLFRNLQDAYVIDDNNYGLYLVTRDSGMWNKDDAQAFAAQIERGGNRYFADHRTELAMKILNPIMIGLSVVGGVSAVGMIGANIAASAIGSSIAGLSVQGISGLSAGVLGEIGASLAAVGTIEGAKALGLTAARVGATIAVEQAVMKGVTEAAKAAGASNEVLIGIEAGTKMLLMGLTPATKNLLSESIGQGKLVWQGFGAQMAEALKTGVMNPTKMGTIAADAVNKVAESYNVDLFGSSGVLNGVPGTLVKAYLSSEDMTKVARDAVITVTKNAITQNMNFGVVGDMVISRMDSIVDLVDNMRGSLPYSDLEKIKQAVVEQSQRFIMTDLPRIRGAMFSSPEDERMFKNVAKLAYSDAPPVNYGNYNLVFKSDTIIAYVDEKTKRVMVGFRGTKDARDVSAWVPTGVGNLSKTERYNYDKQQVLALLGRYGLSEYNYFATGHSLGGSLATEFMRKYGFKNAVTYNQAVAPKDLFTADSDRVKRVYTSSDILYNMQGGKYVASEVMKGKDVGGSMLDSGMTMIQGHFMDNFFVDERKDAGYNY